MEQEKFIEQQKAQVLFEQAAPATQLSGDILGLRHDRLTGAMAVRHLNLGLLVSTMPDIFTQEDIDHIVVTYHAVEGWNILKAIEAEGVRAQVENREQKHGLLAGMQKLFGGGDK